MRPSETAPVRKSEENPARRGSNHVLLTSPVFAGICASLFHGDLEREPNRVVGTQRIRFRTEHRQQPLAIPRLQYLGRHPGQEPIRRWNSRSCGHRMSTPTACSLQVARRRPWSSGGACVHQTRGIARAAGSVDLPQKRNLFRRPSERQARVTTCARRPT